MSFKSLVVLAAVLSVGACSNAWGPTPICYVDEQSQDQVCTETPSLSDFGSQPVFVDNNE